MKNVHRKLQEADHDYQGHRVRAMGHVSQALRHLGSSDMGGFGSSSSLGDMAQARSDEILRDSILKLRNVEGRLGTHPSGAQHFGEARSSLSGAIRELETALTIR